MATSRMRAQEYGQGTDLDSSRWGAEASWKGAVGRAPRPIMTTTREEEGRGDRRCSQRGRRGPRRAASS